MAQQDLVKGDSKELQVTRAAHGGHGIAIADRRVVFIAGTYPGDQVQASITQVKKNFARAVATKIIVPSPMRTTDRCPAAAAGAGCCDYSTLQPKNEIQLKAGILADQLQRLGGLPTVPEIKTIDMPPHTGWRTRVRLGVNNDGYAGMRKLHSAEVVATEPCSQAVSGLLEGIVGAQASRFHPGAELVAVLDDAGQRHLIETRKAARGRRSDEIIRVLEGTGTATQVNAGFEFRLPATQFWQAHKNAIAAYSSQIASWCAGLQPRGTKPTAWDLFGGVGALIPPLLRGLGKDTQVESVEASPAATAAGRLVFDANVSFHAAPVEKIVPHLKPADLVLLDPPRVGAGQHTITQIAARLPQRIIHIGCDPATFARDMRSWLDCGYRLEEVVVFNAFPGTHHFETLGLLVPTSMLRAS